MQTKNFEIKKEVRLIHEFDFYSKEDLNFIISCNNLDRLMEIKISKIGRAYALEIYYLSNFMIMNTSTVNLFLIKNSIDEFVNKYKFVTMIEDRSVWVERNIKLANDVISTF